MPQITYELPDVDVMITRPISMAVIRSIIGVTGMPEDTFIEFAGDSESIATWRTTLDQQPFSQTNTARFGFFSKVKVGYQEEATPETILNSAYYYPDNSTVWADKTLGIYLCPYIEQVKARLSFTYRTRDKNEAMTWRNRMRKKMKLHFIDESFNAAYNIPLPYTLMDFFIQFHQMRENTAGYNQTFDEWFKQNLLADYTVLVTQGGKKPQFVFRETQLDILGNFEFDSPPIEEKLDDGAAYEIEFSYRFSYDRPFGYWMRYPLVIHNQLIPKRYRSETSWYDSAEREGRGAVSTLRYREMFKGQMWYKNLNRGNIIPSYDDWMPGTVPADTTNLAQFLVRVDTTKPTKVLSLTGDLGTMRFDPLLIKYMKENPSALTKRSGSFVHIAVYAGKRMIDPRNLVIDSDLTIWSTVELDLRTEYHVRVGLFTQLFVLQPAANLLLRQNPDYFKMVVDALDPEYVSKYPYPVPVGGVLISRTDYADVARRLKVTAERYYSPEYRYILMPTQLNTLFQTTS